MEVVIDPKSRILCVSKLHKGRVHDFKIRQSKTPFPTVLILAGSVCQVLQRNFDSYSYPSNFQTILGFITSPSPNSLV